MLHISAAQVTEYELGKIKELIDQFEQACSKQTLVPNCITSSAHTHRLSARLANQELTIQAEWAPLIAVLYQDDQFHQLVVAQHHQLLSSFVQGNEDDAVIQARKIISMLTDQMLRYKLSIE